MKLMTVSRQGNGSLGSVLALTCAAKPSQNSTISFQHSEDEQWKTICTHFPSNHGEAGWPYVVTVMCILS